MVAPNESGADHRFAQPSRASGRANGVRQRARWRERNSLTQSREGGRDDPATDIATWFDRSYDVGDIPVTDVAFDNVRGDLYAATDFGVFRLPAGTTDWVAAAPGMPNVEVAGLTIVPGARRLYAATHGLGAWLLNLP